jgi:hypothetical protein
VSSSRAGTGNDTKPVADAATGGADDHAILATSTDATANIERILMTDLLVHDLNSDFNCSRYGTRLWAD